MRIETIEDLLIDHLPNRYNDTLKCYQMWEHEDWEDRDSSGELKGFISYFKLDFNFDMIITAAQGNVFSRAQWKILKHTIENRVKPLRIESDPSNKALHKAAARLGGKFFESEIFFPAPGERYT